MLSLPNQPMQRTGLRPAADRQRSAHSMKRLSDITVADLQAEPVWIYHSRDTDNDADVEPGTKRALSESDPVAYIARTRFIFADGSVHIGFCSPQDASGMDYLQPIIVTSHGHVRLWFDQPPTNADLDKQWTRLGRTPSEIFPVSMECEIPVDGVHMGRLVNLRDIRGTD